MGVFPGRKTVSAVWMTFCRLSAVKPAIPTHKQCLTLTLLTHAIPNAHARMQSALIHQIRQIDTWLLKTLSCFVLKLIYFVIFRLYANATPSAHYLPSSCLKIKTEPLQGITFIISLSYRRFLWPHQKNFLEEFQKDILSPWIDTMYMSWCHFSF